VTKRPCEALHPEREPLDTLERIRRTIGEYNFAGQSCATMCRVISRPAAWHGRSGVAGPGARSGARRVDP
jgi:hypothetical protein